MSAFMYRPLTPGPTRIRLIQLLPTVPNDATSAQPAGSPSSTPQACRLFHANLDDPPPYLALSYTWGDPSATRRILLDGAPALIGENLEAAMRQLASNPPSNLSSPPSPAGDPPYLPLNLWADALCINQGDPVEKTEQILHMRSIYSRASHGVVCWLGPAADDSDVAMSWIDGYGGRAHALGIGSKVGLRLGRLLQAQDAGVGLAGLADGVAEFLDDVRRELSGEGPAERRARRALRRLFGREYWSRIWVVQEVALGQDLVFRCGEAEVSEDSVHHALRLVRNYAGYLSLRAERGLADAGTTPHDIPTINPINMLKVRRGNGPFELAYLLRLLWNYRATDPRDKVFALLGIAADADALDLRPSYLKSAPQVYIETAMALYRAGYTDFLSLCGTYVATLPSWVPNFASSRTGSALQQRSLKRQTTPAVSVLEPQFAAGGTDTQRATFTTGTDLPADALSLPGVRLGTVQATGTRLRANRLTSWLQEVEVLFGPLLGADPVAQRRAVWRTAVADHEVRQGEQKPRLSEAVVARLLDGLDGVHLGEVDAERLEGLGLRDYAQQLETVVPGRRPFTTGRHVGIGPSAMRAGDGVFVLAGVAVPLILRSDAQAKLRTVGEAFVYGVMDGEAVRDGQLGEITIH